MSFVRIFSESAFADAQSVTPAFANLELHESSAFETAMLVGRYLIARERNAITPEIQTQMLDRFGFEGMEKIGKKFDKYISRSYGRLFSLYSRLQDEVINDSPSDTDQIKFYAANAALVAQETNPALRAEQINANSPEI
jgi:hypothetical protein